MQVQRNKRSYKALKINNLRFFMGGFLFDIDGVGYPSNAA
jgi:hypothetical protein